MKRKQGLEPSPRIVSVLETLLTATYYALDTDSDIWDFAVPKSDLAVLGANETDLRWLVRKGLVAHQREVTVEGENDRAFRPSGSLTFCDESCFVLTDPGMQIARGYHVQEESRPVNGFNPFTNSEGDPHRLILPHWDSKSRRLQVDGHTVKRFRWPAINQEAILCAFEEEGWPDRIDDPLAPQPEQDPKRRLADTIKCLNRKQENRLIHFRGDGTGEGVTWEQILGQCSTGNN